MHKNALTRLLRSDGLPVAPGITGQIVRLRSSGNAGATELARVLSLDPALAARLLRTANSAVYGLRREVISIEQAIVVIGVSNTWTLALSLAVFNGYDGSARSVHWREAFWARSLTAAVYARTLALRVAPLRREEAFLAGLLADFGELLLSELAPGEYQPVLDGDPSEPLHDREAVALGTTHMALGATVLESWNLPESLCEAVAHHHYPDRLGDRPDLHCLATLAGFGTRCAEILAAGQPERATELVALASDAFDLGPEVCADVLSEGVETIPALAEVLDVRIDDAKFAELVDSALRVLGGG